MSDDINPPTDQPRKPVVTMSEAPPDQGVRPGQDPPNAYDPGEEYQRVSEVATPRDAIFLTTAQEIAKKLDFIGTQVIALNLMVAGLCIAVFYYGKKIGGGS